MDKQRTAEELEQRLEARRAEYRAWQESPEFRARMDAHREYDNARYEAIVTALADAGRLTDPIAAPLFTGHEHWYEVVSDDGETVTQRRAWCRRIVKELRVLMTEAERADTRCPLCEANEALLASDGTGPDLTDPDQIELRRYEEHRAGRALAVFPVTFRADWRRMEQLEVQMQSYGELYQSYWGEPAPVQEVTS